ncbi:hypothetical protein [Sinorhizobium meliloti]|uniref:hypothetical protein n=1 Tax=Rhizobium meliloti TaxID=382 RepID=UPI001F1E5313|nr:hypothetical protein [Sinorhizobium meliloti]
MADKEKMKHLIWDCQKGIAAYLLPESGISEHELPQMLNTVATVARQRKCLATAGKGSDLMKMMATEMAAQRLGSERSSQPEFSQPSEDKIGNWLISSACASSLHQE